jgi:hypothetical protein
MSRLQLVEQVALAAQARVAAEREPIRVVKRAHVRGRLEQELVRRRAPHQARARGDHAIRGRAAKRHAVNEHGIRRQASETIEGLELRARRLVQAFAGVNHPRPFGRRLAM